MKGLGAGFALSLAFCAPLLAQERERSLERITVALQQPSPIVRGFAPLDNDLPKKLGLITVVPPVLRGEFVRVSVPVGELVTGAVRGIASARRRRQEAGARRQVEADLRLFEEQRGLKPPPPKQK
jgi:hypothetical protein